MNKFIAISAVLVSMLCSSEVGAQEEKLKEEVAQIRKFAIKAQKGLTPQRKESNKKAVQYAIELHRILAGQQLGSRLALSNEMQKRLQANQQQLGEYFQHTHELLLEAAKNNPGKYWIGVQCEPAPSQTIKFGDDEIPLTVQQIGLIVNAVVPDSPAAAAGLAEGDVILRFNNVETNEFTELSDAIGKVGAKESKIHVLRHGRLEKLTVTPIERKEKETDPEAEHEAFANWSATLAGNEIPEDYAVSIFLKQGEEPSIKLSRGETEVLVTNATLDKVPEELKPFADRAMKAVNDMYQPNIFHMNINENEYPVTYRIDSSRLPILEAYEPVTSPSTNEKLEKIEKALEQLHKEVLELKEQK